MYLVKLRIPRHEYVSSSKYLTNGLLLQKQQTKIINICLQKNFEYKLRVQTNTVLQKPCKQPYL